MQWPSHLQPTHARWELVDDRNNTGSSNSPGRLPRLDPVYGRNFRIHDLCLESAPESWFGTTGLDEELDGLSSIPPTVLEELPADCLRSFQEAKAREAKWREKWHTERIDGLRAHLLPSVEWFPK